MKQRTREIGIRMALGAASHTVVGMVVWQCMLLVAIGCAIGAAWAVLVAPLFANQMEAIQPYDLTAYLAAMLLIAAASLRASLRPPQRAVAVDRLVNQRTREIGIRMALGAGSHTVVGMVVWQCMLLVAIGCAIGAALALLVAPLFANQVEGIQPYELTAYLAAMLLIAAASLGASLRPAQRAVAVDPLVNQRTREIGIRMALGAGSNTVVGMAVSQCMLLVAIGCAIGAALALLVAPLFANQMEAIQPYDLTAYLAAMLLIAAASLGASLRPAQRAVAVDPLSALRCD